MLKLKATTIITNIHYMPETVPNILHTFSFRISQNPMEKTTVLMLILKKKKHYFIEV